MDNEKKKTGKGLRVFAIILLIISLGLIGTGSYLMFVNNGTKTEENIVPPDNDTDILEEDLDINGEEVTTLFNNLKIDKITNNLASDNIRNFYFKNDTITDEFKLYLALLNMDQVINYQKDSMEQVEIGVDEIEAKVSSLFESERSDKSYKDFNLGDGIQATYQQDTNKYIISASDIENSDLSKYYAELYQAKRIENQIMLTVKSYYASYEAVADSDKYVYHIYKDDSKTEKLSGESGFESIPALSDMGIEEDRFETYQFIFVLNNDNYVLSSYNKI